MIPLLRSTEKGSLHPYVNYSCTAMLLFNLNTPYWISVQCDQKVSGNVICQSKDMRKRRKIQKFPASQMCTLSNILNNGTCYAFFWVKANKRKRWVCKSRHVHANDLEFIFNAVDVSFPPIFTQDCQHIVVFKRYLTQYHYSTYLSEPDKHAHHVLSKNTQDFPSGGNIFFCRGSSFISHILLCNGIPDCLHQDDEANCDSDVTTPEKLQSQCSHWYLIWVHGKCQMLFMSYAQSKEKETKVILSHISCANATHVPQVLIDDLIPDCTPSNIDEVQLTQTNLSSYSCFWNGLLQCVSGHDRCYNVSSVCVFMLNQYGHLTPCRTGEHLYNCQYYECNGKFKCSDFYCIPWEYVCDGKWDCPYGADELETHNCKKRLCKNMLHCLHSQICIHMTSVCDRTKNCPHGDDEHHCSLWEVRCPFSCICVVFAMKCVNFNISGMLFFTKMPFYFVQIVECSLPSVWRVESQKTFVIFVLKYCNLKELCHLTVTMRNILKMDVSFNALHILPAHCFQYQTNVKVISLNHNFLGHIHENSFAGLTSLSVLNLSSNPLKTFSSIFVQQYFNLSVLSLVNCSLNGTHEESLITSNLRILEVDIFEICCLLQKQTKCTALIPWHSSCADLLSTKGIKITFYVISLLLFTLNVGCILLHVLTPQKLYFSLTIISVNVVDIYMCFPLTITWVIDISLNENYIVNALTWRSSPLCHATFGINLMFSFLSPTFLSFLSVSRLMIVVSPMNTHFKQTSSVVHYVIFIFTTVAVLCTGLASLSGLSYSTNPTGFCSPVMDPTDQVLTIKIFTCLIAGCQLVAIFLIIVAYLSLISHLQKAPELGRCTKQTTKSKPLVKVTVKVIVCVISCTSCWIPSGVIFLTAIFLPQYPTLMLVWTAVAVVPINSIVNPVAFIAAAVRKPDTQNTS